MKSHATATRRQFLRHVAAASGAAVAAGVAADGLFGGPALGRGARPSAVGSGASATTEAVRMALDPGELLLPVETGDGLIVLDNFGGRSVSFGACSHKGIDVFPTTDEVRTLVACVDGVIEGQRFLDGSQGNAWILQDDKGISYRYHHIAEFLDGLEVGDRVERGQPIATMGKTGNAGAEHLHFEIRLNGSSGTAIDAIPYFTFPLQDVELRSLGDTVDCPIG